MAAKKGTLSMLRPGNGIGWILSIGASSLEGRTVRSISRVRPLSAAYSGAAVVVEAHLLQHRELDLQELDRHPAHRQLGLGDDRRGQQAHRLDRVLGGGVVDVHVDARRRRARSAWSCRCPRPVTPSCLQEEAQVLDHVVGGGVADDGDAVVPGGGQQRVLGDGVAALGQHDGAVRGDACGPPRRGRAPRSR